MINKIGVFSTGNLNTAVPFPHEKKGSTVNGTEEANALVDMSEEYKNKVKSAGGRIADSQYGYARVLNEVSADYARAVSGASTPDYENASQYDVISDLNEKYGELRKDIEENYTGKEKEERLASLDEDYAFILDANIIKPMEHSLQYENIANRLRAKIGSFYEKRKEKYGEEVANQAYSNMNNWKEVHDVVSEQLTGYLDILNQLKAMLENADRDAETGKSMDSLLKSINKGMAGVERKKEELSGKIDESEDEQLKEIWSLIDKKLEIVFDGNQTYDSDEQKYKAFLKNVSQTEGLDQRMEEIFSEMLKDGD